MKNVYKQKREQGFTIIEVLIVLAIAALIFLIVFLAVPALQRNSRNTSRKSDVANVLAAINEYVSNNNGSLPTTCSGTNPIQIGAAATGSQAKVGYFTGGCVTSGVANGQVEILASFAATAALNGASKDYVIIVPGASCSSGAAVAGGARSIAALYEIENGSGTFASQCQES